MTCGKKHGANCPTDGSKVTQAEVEGRPMCDHAGCEQRVVGTGEKCADGHVQGKAPATRRPAAPTLATEVAQLLRQTTGELVIAEMLTDGGIILLPVAAGGDGIPAGVYQAWQRMGQPGLSAGAAPRHIVLSAQDASAFCARLREAATSPGAPVTQTGRSATGAPGERRQATPSQYAAPLQQVVQHLGPTTFQEIVDPQVQAAGDALILGETSSGYNALTMYEVAGQEFMARLLGQPPSVFYSMYNGNGAHGVAVLEQMARDGLAVPYDVGVKASCVRWDKEWGDDSSQGVQYDEQGQVLLARSVEYVLAFYPRDVAEAERLALWFEDRCNSAQQDAIPGSWEVPDVRWNGGDRIDDHQQCVVNYRQLGAQTLIALTQRTQLAGFEHRPLFVNHGLFDYLS